MHIGFAYCDDELRWDAEGRAGLLRHLEGAAIDGDVVADGDARHDQRSAQGCGAAPSKPSSAVCMQLRKASAILWHDPLGVRSEQGPAR